MAHKVAWGIDIGESAVKAVKLRRAGDSVTILEYRTIPCEAHGERAQLGDRELHVRNALAELQVETSLKGASLAVSLPGREVFPRFIPLPPVERKRIPEIVRYEARTQMPFPMEEVVWDYQPVTGLDVPGEEVEVAFFAAKKATVYGYLTNLRLAKLVPDLVEIGPLAAYNFLMYDRDITAGTVVIDVGAANTDLVIIDRERFWVRSVGISGNDITRALQEKYQISFEEAENLKRKAATSTQAEKLFGAVRPIVDDLLGEVQRSIGYYKTQTRQVRIERVLLLGRSFKLPQLVEYFRKNLDYEVTLLDRLERVKVATSADPEKFEAELPNYAVAVGLALQALRVARVNIDLLPRDLVRERLLRRKVPYAAAILLLLAAPLGISYQKATDEFRRATEDVAPLDQEINGYRKLLDAERQWSDLGPLGARLQLFGTLGTGRLEWLYFLDDLNTAVNTLAREPFRLNGIRLVSAEEAVGAIPRGDLGVVGAHAVEVKPGEGLKIEVRFEKDTPFTAKDIDELGRRLQARPFVRAVEGRGQADLTDPAGAGAPRRTPAAAGERAPTGQVYAFWVTYSSKPLAAKPGAEVAPPKAAPARATRPAPRPAPRGPSKRGDLTKVD